MRVRTIEARWAIRIAEDLKRAGQPLSNILTEVGLARTDFSSAEHRIPYAAYVGLIERAALLLADSAYGLKLGASHDVRDHGLIGFVALNSSTLKDALSNIERYLGVTNDGIDAVLETIAEGSALRFRETDASLRGLRHNSEQAAAHLVVGFREITRRRATPLRVEFMHARPNARIDYESILACPVKFGAEWDGVVYSRETLELPVVGADNRLLRVLEAACRKIIGPAPRKQDFVHAVREQIVQQMSKGVPSFDKVADHFGVGSKTLERRLAERGESYRRLVDRTRCDLVKHYLASTDLRLQEIAYLAGYSEPAPLVRAFKRWTGRTPMQYRSEQQG